MIKSILNFFFPSLMREVFNEGVREGQKNENFRSIQSRRDIAVFELDKWVGNKIISISNEWSDPYIGIGLRIEYFSKTEVPFLVSANAITGEEHIHFGKIISFTPQNLAALMVLNPYERWSLLTGQKISIEPKDEVVLSSYEQIMEKLKENNFI
jgi:hypothetical protein